jgi:hypothetical protein
MPVAIVGIVELVLAAEGVVICSDVSLRRRGARALLALVGVVSEVKGET